MPDGPPEHGANGTPGDARVSADGVVGAGGAGGAGGAASVALVPEWLVNLAALGWRVLVIAGLAVVIGYVALLLWTVTASIIVAIVIAAAFAPLMLRLVAGGRSRTGAAAITWVAALGVIAVLALLLVLAFLPIVLELLTSIDDGVADLQSRVADLGAPAWVSTVITEAVAAVRSATASDHGEIVATVASIAGIMVLAVFLTFYFLRDGDKAWLWIFQVASERKRELITSAGDEALAHVGGYLRGTTVLSAAIAASDLVFMLLLGVPYALPLAVLVFFAGYIPYFGGIVTAAIILLVTLGELGPEAVLALLVLFVVRDVALRYLVRPAVFGRTVVVHPAAALIALLAGFELAGLVGLVAAVPVAAVIQAVATAVTTILAPDARPPLPDLVPAWLDRVAQVSWRALVGVGLVALLIIILTTLPLLLIPVILALILAATLEPVADWLIGRGVSRAMAAALAVGGGFFAVAAVLVLSMASLVEQAPELGLTVTSGANSVDDALGGHLQLGTEALASTTAAAVRTIVELGQAFGALVVVAVVSALLTFYLMRDGAHVWDRLLEHVQGEVREDVREAGGRAFSVLGGYMTGTAVVSFVGAASQLVIMVVLGLPLALPVFVISFFLSFIPYIGGFISTLIAFLIAVAVGTTTDVVIMFIWTIVFNLVTGSIVAPVVYGKTVHIHPAITLTAIPAGSTIAGILGMFVVVPALGVVTVTWRTVLKVMGSRSDAARAREVGVADTATMIDEVPVGSGGEGSEDSDGAGTQGSEGSDDEGTVGSG